MTAAQILSELKPLGSPGYRKVLANHGVQEPVFGIKISDLKKIQKRVKRDYQLALDLYATGNYDAMYLAGLIADDAKMTKRDLREWVENAYGGALPGSTVPSVAAGSPHGHDLALEWIGSKKPLIASAGWGTLGALVSIKDDAELDIAELRRLMTEVKQKIHGAPDVVRYQMNHFIIAVGAYVAELTDEALKTAEAIGPVTADLGDNSCQVPSAPDYIRKIIDRGTVGKKRKSAKC